ncbi:MAG: translation initiation factor IF-2 N-terminal domain-containing protein, partial [Schaalia odontolytica]
MAKLRVHELAKELGITSKELMGHLKEAGEFVKSSSSSLEPPVVRQMRERFAAAPKTKNAEAKPA